jgi:hypothetical protein
MNATSMVVGFALAERHSLQHDDAVKFGLIASLMPPTPVSLLVVDMLAAKQAEALAAAPSTTPESAQVEVPNVTKPPLALSTASDAVKGAGLVPEVVGTNLIVVGQTPAAATQADEGSVVILTAAGLWEGPREDPNANTEPNPTPKLTPNPNTNPAPNPIPNPT